LPVEVKVLEKRNNYVKFIISGVPVAFVNSLRRTIIAEVPVMAIDEVVILDNTSVMYDEVLAHRLALIPLKTDLESYVLPEECVCGGIGCSRCQVKLVLDVEAKDGDLMVYSGHLKSEDPAIVPVSDKIPIVKLAKGQRIVLEAYARLGRGRDHAKWQPGLAAYKYMPKIVIDESKCNGCGVCVQNCPRNVLEIKDGKVTVSKLLDCNLCRYCEIVCPTKAIRVEHEDSTYVFFVESFGQLDVKTLVLKALEVLDQKCVKFLEECEHAIEEFKKE